MLKIGWAKREYSTSERVNLNGQMYLRLSEGIIDPLYATVLCVDGGEGQDAVIFCSCDMVGLHGGIINATKKRVKALCSEIPIDGIIMNATHAHTSGEMNETPEKTPDGEPIYSGVKYRDFVADKCAEAIVEAWQNRSDGGMAYGYGYAVISHSRRVVYTENKAMSSSPIAPNGKCVMYGETNDKTFSHYEAGADHMLNLMYTFDKDNNLTGIVVNVPCPSQLGENLPYQTSAYWHNVREAVKEEFGANVFVLAQCAGAGDLCPGVMHYKYAHARRLELKYGLGYDPKEVPWLNKFEGTRKEFAERILEGIKEVYSWAKKQIYTDIPVRHVYKTVELSRRFITEEEKLWCEENVKEMQNETPEHLCKTPIELRRRMSSYYSFLNRNLKVLKRYEEQKEKKTIPTILHAVRIGDIAIATNKFELFMDYMHRIQARSPFIQTFVVQLAGDEDSCYLATERATKNNGYSASLFDNEVSFIGGQELVENTLEMLEKINR